MTGIYMIRNKINNKIYIGQAVNISKRWSDHKSSLNKGNHANKHLQSAWDRYGEDSFEFMVLTECPEEQLNTLEQYYIFCLESYNREVGYNNTYGGSAGRHTEDTKRKISESRKGKTAGKNNPMYGKKLGPQSEETKRKKSESMKGKNTWMKTP